MTFSRDWFKVSNAPSKRFLRFACSTVLVSALSASPYACAQTSAVPSPTEIPPAAPSVPTATPQADAPQATPAAVPAPAVPPHPAKSHATASGDTERVLVVGDSQAQGLAGGLRWLYRTNRKVHILDHSKISTGLVSVAFYNWPDQVHKLAATEHADVAVVMFGANDRPPVRVHGAVDPTMLANFTKIYSARVHDIITTLQNAHIPVIWVGHPIVRDETFSADMAILNDIFQHQTTQNNAQFVPLWSTFSEDDHYSAYGEGVDGVKVRLRADDGIHLTPPGYQKAAKILETLIAHYQPGAIQEDVKPAEPHRSETVPMTSPAITPVPALIPTPTTEAQSALASKTTN